MAAYKALPHSFAKIHPRYLTPTVSTIVMGAVSIAIYVPMNYIKRLIGISGETIAVCNGKLYVLPARHSPTYDDLKTELANAKTAEEREQWQRLWFDVDALIRRTSQPK